MPRVKPWSQEAANIIRQLMKNNGRANTSNINLGREFGRKTDLIDKGFLDVATTRYSKKPDKTLFQVPPEIDIVEMPPFFSFKRKKFL